MISRTGLEGTPRRLLLIAAIAAGLLSILAGMIVANHAEDMSRGILALHEADAAAHEDFAHELRLSFFEGLAAIVVGLFAAAAAAFGLFTLGKRQSEDKAESSQRSFAGLLEQGLAGVIVYDADHRILFHNSAARRLLGLSEDGFESRLADILKGRVVDSQGRRLEPADHPLRRSFTERAQIGPEIIGIHFDSGLRWFLISSSPVCSPHGCLEQVIATFLDYTAPREAELALRRNEALLAETEKMAGIGSFEIDACGQMRFSENGETLLHALGVKVPATVEECLVRIDPDDHRRLRLGMETALAGRNAEIELRIIPAEGLRRTVHVKGGPHPGKNGATLGYFRDITEDRLSKERLLLSGNIFDNIIEGITITDALGTILTVNRAFTEITGYSAAEALGQNPRILKSEHHDEAFYSALWSSLIRDGEWEGEIWNRRKDRTVYPEWLSITAIRDANGETIRYMAIFRDITDIKTKEAKINRLSYHDALTDLPNRFLFIDRLESAIKLAERQDSGCAVLYLDLNRFKYINTTFGYRAGDRVLKTAAERITGAVRKADSVARVGGDEFIILLSNIGRAELAVHAAESIQEALKRPILLEGQDLVLSATIGLAFWPSDGNSAEALIAAANAALNLAKESNPGGFHVYTSGLGARISKRLELEAKLRKGLEREEFILHYQPRIGARDRRIEGIEALVRWRTEDGTLIPPGEFIPLAEETGLIVPLGEWVLHKALEEARPWITEHADLTVSVNLSARQFRERSLGRIVEQALQHSGFPASRLELEITESLAMADVERTVELLSSLSERGIQISLDDFGTGYSSLYYLKRLPIHWLKIDQSFVRDIEAESGRSIVSTIIAMARSLSLGTIAEGCETSDQFRFLREGGCDQIQGYFFSRPLSAENFQAFLRSGRHLPEPAA